MIPILLLLLFTPFLGAQVTPDLPAEETMEAENVTDLVFNTSKTLDLFSNTTESTMLPDFTGTPSEVPTEPADDWAAAETFLYTGDPSTIRAARCTRAYSTAGQTGSLPRNFYGPLQPTMDALANTANFLNMIFQASDLRESTVQEDMEWYHALVRALLESNGLIQQALLTFDADPTAQVPQLVLRATRNLTAKIQTIILQDLSKAWESLHPPAPAPDDSWFRRLKFPESNQVMASLSKRVLLNDLNTLDTPKWGQGDSYVTNSSGVRWANAPFLDCNDGRFRPGWVLTLSTSFYGLKPDLTPEFRGVIRADVKIQDFDLDQCATGDSWFADTHQCNRTSMECMPVPGRGFRLGQYCCRCKEGFYNPEVYLKDSDGRLVNVTGSSGMCYPNMPICLPCWPGCKSCQDSTPCWVQADGPLRAVVLALQGVFMLLIFISMMMAYRQRRNRKIRASGLLLLETILFGSLLLYFPVFILSFKPSTFRCILLRWVRMLGFSIVYGTITLKMYRVLKLFLSRTAQRVPYISSFHLLRILGVMLMTVSWFLCAWTVGVLQNRDRNIPVFVTSSTSDGQGFNLCYLDRWDYMMAVAELLFLCWGSSLWTAVRPVPSAFHEPRYMGIAIHNELLLSSMFHMFRFTFTSLHPDWMLLLSFMHTHVTITVTLALLFIPKFLHVSKPGREEIAAEVYEDEVDLRRSGSYLNSSFRSVWSEPSVDPQDFRDELKKLYIQLEVNKTKKMAANNPHLSKKRGSRCTLGRSIIRRIAEIPGTVSRQCSREEKDGSFRSRGSFLSRNENQSDSFRISPDNISYRGSVKSRSPSIRKSLSDHYHVRERDSSLRDSTLRTYSVKRSSQRSDTDSLDIPPGVCKSASAQNLTIDINLLHPDHTRLHKSWSLTSSTTHSIENIPKISRSSTMRSISDQTRSALQSESFDKAEVCPWEVEPEQSEDKSQKHVTYANTEEGEEKRPPSPQALVCPWDHLPPVEKTPSVEKDPQADNAPLKAPVTVSASAPGSPRPNSTKEQRVFSFRSTSNKWLSVKSIMGSFDISSRCSREGTLNREDSQKSQGSTPTISRSGSSSRRPSIEIRPFQRMGTSTTDGKPSLVKQNAVRLSSGDSSDRSPRRLIVMKSVGNPGEADDNQKDGTYEHVYLSRQSSKRSSISSISSRTPSTRRRGSNRIRPTGSITHTDVCPWDGAGSAQQGTGPMKQQSLKAAAGPPESLVSERPNVCPWESDTKGQGEVCPWESQGTSHTTLSKDSQTQHSFKRGAEVCPWENVETPRISIRQDSEYANVCPWDVEGKPEVVYENLSPLDQRGTLSVPHQREAMKSAVYPGRSKGVSNNQTPVPSQGEHASKTAESCPWEFPDPPKIMEDICPWVAGDQSKPGDSEKCPSPQNVVYLQTGRVENTKENVCPRESATPSQEVNRPADVCPWETSEETGKPLQSPVKESPVRTNVCPWEVEGDITKSEVVKQSAKQENSTQNISAQEKNVQKAEKKLDGARTDVCPWDTEESKVVKKQASIQETICPWETEEPKTLKKQDSNRADVCPWDTEEPKPLQKKNSVMANVCPWETEEPKVLKKQDSARADVCPWETEEPIPLQKKDSASTSGFSQNTEEPKTLKKQDSTRADVCPWETEEPKVLKKQDSNVADVCPWETEEPKILKKQDSTRADVCPWDTEEPKPLQKKNSTLANVCPWEAEDTVNQTIDGIKENACAGETFTNVVEQQSPSKDIFPSKDGEPGYNRIDDVPDNCETPADMSMEQTDESKATLALSRRDALCPWDLDRSTSGSFADNTSDVFTWEPENIPEEDEEDDAECAAEALIFPPDL